MTYVLELRHCVKHVLEDMVRLNTQIFHNVYLATMVQNLMVLMENAKATIVQTLCAKFCYQAARSAEMTVSAARNVH